MGLGLWRFCFWGAKTECHTSVRMAPKHAISRESYHRDYEYIFKCLSR